jgi:hypothetical protein
MDDRYLLQRVSQPRIVRAGEFSRLGKSLLACAYERVVPIARVALCGVSSPPRSSSAGQRRATRKVSA